MTKKTISRIFVLLLITVVFCSFDTAPTVAATSASATAIVSPGAYLRTGASVISKRIKVVKKGTKIVLKKEVFKHKTKTSAKYKWYAVTANGKKGYIRSDCIKNIRFNAVSGKITGAVNYRVGPGTKMKKAGTLKKGTKVTVCLEANPVSSVRGSSATWYKIKLNDKYYYVVSTKVKITGSLTSGSASTTSAQKSSSKTSSSSGSSSKTGTMSDAEFNQYLDKQGFPESYKVKLKALHKSHPNWVFIACQTGIQWNDALKKETKKGISAIHQSLPTSYRSTAKYAGAVSETNTDDPADDTADTVIPETSGMSDTVEPETAAEAEEAVPEETVAEEPLPSEDAQETAEAPEVTDTETDAVQAEKAPEETAEAPEETAEEALSEDTESEVAESDGTEPEEIKTEEAADTERSVSLEAPEIGAVTSKASLGYTKIEPGWYNASSKAVAYYMDPRNFLNEDRIYMFEDLSYKSSYQTSSVVEKILKPTVLPKYGFTTDLFMKAGASYDVSPVFLAARARQETGGGSKAIYGTKYNGKVVYNPFNIGAGSGSNPVMNGLKHAYEKGWTTQAKAVNGSASYLASGYIAKGQNSIYFQKFNVANGLINVGSHQYMTNIQAPYNEARSVKLSYESFGITSESLCFIIPVFKGMPSSTQLP